MHAVLPFNSLSQDDSGSSSGSGSGDDEDSGSGSGSGDDDDSGSGVEPTTPAPASTTTVLHSSATTTEAATTPSVNSGDDDDSGSGSGGDQNRELSAIFTSCTLIATNRATYVLRMPVGYDFELASRSVVQLPHVADALGHRSRQPRLFSSGQFCPWRQV